MRVAAGRVPRCAALGEWLVHDPLEAMREEPDHVSISMAAPGAKFQEAHHDVSIKPLKELQSGISASNYH